MLLKMLFSKNYIMMNFKSLNSNEQELLLKFPVYISLLAANADGKLDQKEKLSAIEFNHVKTYSCDPMLAEFFQKVDKDFPLILNELNNALPLGKVNRDVTIKKKLAKLEAIVLKLGPKYTSIMHNSMLTFKDHVSLANHNVLIDFIFPIPIEGLSY
jgi:hypothetical protein